MQLFQSGGHDERRFKENHVKYRKSVLQSFGRNRYADAYAMLTPELQHSLSPETLESHYKEMIAYGGEPVTVDGHTEFMNKWPDKKNDDIGWIYVSISGTTFGEAVTLIITSVKGDPKIRSIEWGRP